MGIAPQPYDPNIITGSNSYSDPAWITALAASKITGTFMKSQQHAQTAYLDQLNTFNHAIKVTQSGIGAVGLDPGGPVQTGHVSWFKPNGTRQGYMGFDGDNNISLVNEVGGQFVTGAARFNGNTTVTGSGNKLTVETGSLHAGHGTTYPASTHATYGLSMGFDGNPEHGWIQAVRFNVGEIRALQLQPLGGNVMIGTVANQSTKFHVEGTSSFSGAATFNDTLNANGVGTNIRIKADGGSLDGALVADGAGNLFLGDFSSLTRGWRINPDGTMATLGTGATTFNGSISANRSLTLGADSAGGERITFQGVTSAYRTVIENNYDSNRAFAITTNGLDVIKCAGDVYGSLTLGHGGTQDVVFPGVKATFNGNLTATGTGNHQFGTGTAYSILANGAITNYIGNGGRFSIAEQWWLYKNDGDLSMYFRDMVNARMQMTFVPGASASAARTYIYSKLDVEGDVRASSGLIYVGPNSNWILESGNTLYFDSNGGGVSFRNAATAIPYFTVSNGGTANLAAGITTQQEVTINGPGAQSALLNLVKAGSDTTAQINFTRTGWNQWFLNQAGSGLQIRESGAAFDSMQFVPGGSVNFGSFITSTFSSSTSDLSTLDLSAGQTRLHKNTLTNDLKLFANDGGTIKTVTLT